MVLFSFLFCSPALLRVKLSLHSFAPSPPENPHSPSVFLQDTGGREEKGKKKGHRYPRPFAPNKVGSKGKNKKERGKKRKERKYITWQPASALPWIREIPWVYSETMQETPQKTKSTFFFPFFNTHTHTHIISHYSVRCTRVCST